MSEQTPLSRQDLELVERVFVASWPHWLRRVEEGELTIAEARDGCWYESEQAVRARPAHLNPGTTLEGLRRRLTAGDRAPGFGFVTIRDQP